MAKKSLKFTVDQKEQEKIKNIKTNKKIKQILP